MSLPNGPFTGNMNWTCFHQTDPRNTWVRTPISACGFPSHVQPCKSTHELRDVLRTRVLEEPLGRRNLKKVSRNFLHSLSGADVYGSVLVSVVKFGNRRHGRLASELLSKRRLANPGCGCVKRPKHLVWYLRSHRCHGTSLNRLRVSHGKLGVSLFGGTRKTAAYLLLSFQSHGFKKVSPKKDTKPRATPLGAAASGPFGSSCRARTAHPSKMCSAWRRAPSTWARQQPLQPPTPPTPPQPPCADKGPSQKKKKEKTPGIFRRSRETV